MIQILASDKHSSLFPPGKKSFINLAQAVSVSTMAGVTHRVGEAFEVLDKLPENHDQKRNRPQPEPEMNDQNHHRPEVSRQQPETDAGNDESELSRRLVGPENPTAIQGLFCYNELFFQRKRISCKQSARWQQYPGCQRHNCHAIGKFAHLQKH